MRDSVPGSRYWTFRLLFAKSMLTDSEVEEIRAGVKLGLRGPVLLTWVEALLRDRDERMELEKKTEAERPAIERARRTPTRAESKMPTEDDEKKK